MSLLLHNVYTYNISVRDRVQNEAERTVVLRLRLCDRQLFLEVVNLLGLVAADGLSGLDAHSMSS